MLAQVNNEEKVVMLFFGDEDECNLSKNNVKLTDLLHLYKQNGYKVCTVISGKKDVKKVIENMLLREIHWQKNNC